MEGSVGNRFDTPDNQVAVELANLNTTMNQAVFLLGKIILNTTMNQAVFLLGKIMMSLDKIAAMLSTGQKLERPSF
jgi:hypothetical protein